MAGSIRFADIYGSAPGYESTQDKGQQNVDAPAKAAPKTYLGQPVIVYLGLVGLLIAVKVIKKDWK